MQNSMKSYFRRLAEGYENGWTVSVLAPFLEAAAGVYAASSQGMRGLYETRILPKQRLRFPVVSVGNLTWGGTGKTPLVEYLARKVSDRNRVPLILTRGYSNDEVAQFRRHLPKAVLGVGRNRVQAAQEAAKNQPVDIALLDDGFQHWPVKRDLEILTINGLNPFGNGKLIPRGILREPLSALRRAHAVVVSHSNLAPAEEIRKLRETVRQYAPQALWVESYLEPLFFYRAKNRERVMLDRLQKHKVTTFSAIGSPRSFQLLLASIQIKPVRNFEFTDHHVFSDKELQEIRSVSESARAEEVVTTEKDFYRSPEQLIRALNPLVLATRLRIKSGEEMLMEKIFRLLESGVR